MRALALVARAFGPRRSLAFRTSGTHPILKRVLTLGLRVQNLGLLLQKRAVVALDLQEAIDVDAIQLRDGGGNVFQKVAAHG